MAKKNIETSSDRRIISSINPKSPITEQYRTIRTNIEFMMADRGYKTILVTSAEAGAGKSTLMSNLAVVFAQQGRKILLIDADIRKPAVHITFRTSNSVGLTNVLSRQTLLSNALQKTHLSDNLSVLTSGPIPPNPSELLGSLAMEEMIENAKKHFDIVLVDAPPIIGLTDAQILSRWVDGVIIVARANQTKKEDLARAKKLLDQVQANVIGSVLTSYATKDTAYYYYYGTEQ